MSTCIVFIYSAHINAANLLGLSHFFSRQSNSQQFNCNLNAIIDCHCPKFCTSRKGHYADDKIKKKNSGKKESVEGNNGTKRRKLYETKVMQTEKEEFCQFCYTALLYIYIKIYKKTSVNFLLYTIDPAVANNKTKQ